MTLIGHLIVAEVVSGVSRPTVIYTPWSGRQGNAFTSTFEVSAISGTDVKVTVEVLEKDADDTGAGTLNSGTGTNYRIGTGVSSFRNSDCKQVTVRPTTSVFCPRRRDAARHGKTERATRGDRTMAAIA